MLWCPSFFLFVSLRATRFFTSSSCPIAAILYLVLPGRQASSSVRVVQAACRVSFGDHPRLGCLSIRTRAQCLTDVDSGNHRTRWRDMFDLSANVVEIGRRSVWMDTYSVLRVIKNKGGDVRQSVN